MGCDIHVVIQTKNWRDERWSTFAGLGYLGRWYTFFGELADVRGVPTKGPVAAGRGLPCEADGKADPALEAAFVDGFDLGDHSHTWCTPDEWEFALREASLSDAETLRGKIVGWFGRPSGGFADVLSVCRALEGYYEVRLLIGFDS